MVTSILLAVAVLLEEFFVYYLPEPPYFVLIIGLFVSITSGLSFAKTLEQKTALWKEDPALPLLEEMLTWSIQLPYLGMAIGICLFLAAGMEVFGFPSAFAYLVAVPLTVGTQVWSGINSSKC